MHAVMKACTEWSGSQWMKQLGQLSLGVVSGGFTEEVAFEQYLIMDWK